MQVKDVKEKTEVTLKGWVQDIKDLSKITFIQLRDSSGSIQVTILKSEIDLPIVKDLTRESVIEVSGMISETLELIPSDIKILVKREKDLPFSLKEEPSQSVRFDWRCLDIRRPRLQALFRIQSAIVDGMRSCLLKKDYIQVFTPCLMGVASESGSEVFPIIYFDREAFLRQDPQLHRQLAIASGLTHVFDIGPAWRAEQSHTSRHLCEHRVCAVETAFIQDEYDTIRLQEELIISALSHITSTCKQELDVLEIKLKVPKQGFPVITFPEVYDILRDRGKVLDEGEDLDTESEKIIWEYVKESFGVDFYFVSGFPSEIKPFYVMKEGKWARSVDLYYKGLELSSGGQREHRYEKLPKSSELEWFTKFFQFGVPPHGGFALGIERLTQGLLEIDSIKDCALFPRDPERLVP